MAADNDGLPRPMTKLEWSAFEATRMMRLSVLVLPINPVARGLTCRTKECIGKGHHVPARCQTAFPHAVSPQNCRL